MNRNKPRFGNNRDRGDRGDRSERSSDSRRPRPYGNRDQRDGVRSDRGERSYDSRRPRSFGDRDSREGGERSERPRRFYDDKPRYGDKREFRDGGYQGGSRSKPFQKSFDRPRRDFNKSNFRNEDRPNRARQSDRPHLGEDEIRYHGLNACIAIFKMRRQDIVRVYVRHDLEETFAEVIEDCARNHKSYHLVTDDDLESLTDSKNHQGICFVTKERHLLSEVEFYKAALPQRCNLIYLDGVANPHNLGAILRTAAHFGVPYIALPFESLPRLSAASHRTSEGGAEYVSIIRVRNPQQFFLKLKDLHFDIYGLDVHEPNQPMYGTRLRERAVFTMGSEVAGISELASAFVDVRLRIPGTGTMESMNVSVAAGLAMGEFYRQSQEKTVRIVKSKT